MKRAWTDFGAVISLCALTIAGCGGDRIIGMGETGETESDSATVGDGEPGDGEPGDGEPGDGDPGDGDPGDGDPGDGDPGDGDGDPDPNCGAPSDHITCDDWGTGATPFQVLGLDCPGDASNSTPTTDSSFDAPDGASWRIGTQFGTSGDWVPREGESLLVISTGRIPAPSGPGVITSQGNQQMTSNPDGVDLPPPMSPDEGSNGGNGGSPFQNCDFVNDCSDSLSAQWQAGDAAAFDLLSFGFAVDVPMGTKGWKIDLAYFSSEFPEFVNQQYNDMFVVWQVSEAYVGNVCFIDGEPCTVTALDEVADMFSGNAEGDHPSLAGTGMDGSGSMGGQTTGWVGLEGPAVPGENLEISFAIFDMGDATYDLCVANLVLGEQVVDWQAALGELLRVTKPGGQVLATVQIAAEGLTIADLVPSVAPILESRTALTLPCNTTRP